MDAKEIKITITPQEDGGINTKLALDVDLPLSTALVALEITKKQIMTMFTDYCDKNGIDDYGDVFEKYGEIKISDLYS